MGFQEKPFSHRPSKPLLSKNGFTLDYKMGSSARGSNIRLTDKKLMPSRPDAVRIRIASALAMPTQLSLTHHHSGKPHQERHRGI